MLLMSGAGVVDGVGCILLGAVRVGGRSLGVQLIGSLVDLRLHVLSPGGSIGLHLGSLALGSIGGLFSLLLGVLHGLIRVVLCLIDALLELVAVLGGCRPRSPPSR
jgi:hypothetical protein